MSDISTTIEKMTRTSDHKRKKKQKLKVMIEQIREIVHINLCFVSQIYFFAGFALDSLFFLS